MSSAFVGPADCGVSPISGFLPETDPLDRLSLRFEPWEHIAQSLPRFFMSDRLRELLVKLSPFPTAELRTPAEWERAMVLLSYLGHAYVWCGERPATTLPVNLAVPWHAVASRLGRPPVLSYASYCLHNWRRLQPERPAELGNIALIQGFLGGQDEEWFVLIHVEIERRAAPALAAMVKLQEAVYAGDTETIHCLLGTVNRALERVNETMDRMPERCDPYIYYHRVGPYIHGWRNHPDMPDGLIYEGVEAYQGKPQTFRGETGAQSGIVPTLDALFGVEHAPDILRSYLQEMRTYMPPGHQAFVERLETGPSLRAYVKSQGGELVSDYDACVALVERFRTTHLEYAAKYIFQQAQHDPKNPHDLGTGGTPFMPYLKKHRDETRDSRLV